MQSTPPIHSKNTNQNQTFKKNFDLKLETEKQKKIIKSLYEKLENRPLSSYENVDLNARTFEGKDLPEGATLAMIMASEPNLEGDYLKIIKEDEPNISEKTNLLAKVLRAYPKHIETLDLNTEISGNYPDDGVSLAILCAGSSPSLFKEIIIAYPHHGKNLNLTKKPSYHEGNLAVCLIQFNTGLLEKILLDHPHYMIKNINLAFYILLISNRKISIDLHEVFAQLSLECTSLDQLYDLMKNYTKAELKTLSSKKQTISMSNACLINKAELKVSILSEELKVEEQQSERTKIINKILRNVASMSDCFIHTTDSKFRDFLVLKMIQNFILLKEIHRNNTQEFNDALTSIHCESLFHYTYSSSSNFHSAKSLPINRQLDFEINHYFLESKSLLPEYDNYLIQLLQNQPNSQSALEKQNQCLNDKEPVGKRETLNSIIPLKYPNPNPNSVSHPFYDKIIPTRESSKSKQTETILDSRK